MQAWEKILDDVASGITVELTLSTGNGAMSCQAGGVSITDVSDPSIPRQLETFAAGEFGKMEYAPGARLRLTATQADTTFWFADRSL